jgi:hypothetical protein
MSINSRIPLPGNIARENHNNVRYFTTLVGKKKQWASQVREACFIAVNLQLQRASRCIWY